MNQQPILKRKSLWRRILTPRLVFFVGLLVLALTIVFAYFYVNFSEMIDDKLRGNVFVKATGIYTSPVKLRAGQPFKRTELVGYLDHIGYVGDGKPQDSDRGHYSVKGNLIEIKPSDVARIDGRALFPYERVKYSEDGQRISNLTDLSEKKTIDSCLIEPELLTAVNREREK